MLRFTCVTVRPSGQLWTKPVALVRRWASQAPTLKDLPKDEAFNVSPTIESKLGAGLHLRPNHPISIIRTKIYDYFDQRSKNPSFSKSPFPVTSFQTFDTLPPFVSTKQNFDDLLTPPEHESRRPSDTYYVNSKTVLRTHTSAHQTELIRKGISSFLVTADVYRRDSIDSTHYPVFHQMEGVRVFSEAELQAHDPQKHVELVKEDLKDHLEGMVKNIFGQVPIRWVDAYFPFTVPSLEMEIFYRNEWLEVLGCGVINQPILNNCGYAQKKGWAFGLGLERLALVLFEIPDIRLFWSEDARFISQFSEGKITKFKPYSKYPPVTKDVSFWLPASGFHPNNLFELIRGQAPGDIIERVDLVDSFKHPKTGKESHCYRITFRSMDRNLTHEEINAVQENIRRAIVQHFKVELR